MDIFKYMLAVVLIVLFGIPISFALIFSVDCISLGYFGYFVLLLITAASLFFTCIVTVEKVLELE
jgi:hypothetical protein